MEQHNFIILKHNKPHGTNQNILIFNHSTDIFFNFYVLSLANQIRLVTPPPPNKDFDFQYSLGPNKNNEGVKMGDQKRNHCDAGYCTDNLQKTAYSVYDHWERHLPDYVFKTK